MPQYMAAGLDQKIVAARMLSYLKSKRDFGAYFTTDLVADINAKHTSTAVIRKEPTVNLAPMPADRDGLLPRTGTSSSFIEVTLTSDEYFKVGVDTLDIEPEKLAAELGVAGGKALLGALNADLLGTAGADGTQRYLGETFSATTTADEVWSQLVGLIVPFQEAEYTEGSRLFVAPAVWARLIEGQATLRTTVDPRAQAAQLLGVTSVDVTPVKAGKLAILAHADSLVQPRRIAGIRSGVEDFDDIVEGRIKFGSKVLDANTVQVLNDGAAPVA